MSLNEMTERVIANQRRQILMGALFATVIAAYFNIGFIINGSVGLWGFVSAIICAMAWFSVWKHKVAADRRKADMPTARVVK